MHFQLDLNTILNFVTVAGVAWLGKFIYRVEHRLTKIETFCGICYRKKLLENENENDT